MAVRIRLARYGSKKKPFYRLVAADSRAPRDGCFIETLGYYNPREEPSLIKVNEGRVKYWLNQGAKPSETVEKLLRISGLQKEIQTENQK